MRLDGLIQFQKYSQFLAWHLFSVLLMCVDLRFLCMGALEKLSVCNEPPHTKRIESKFICIFEILGRVNLSGHWRPYWMMSDDDDNDGQMIFGDLGGLKLPDICLTDEEKPRKNLTQETCPDLGSNPGPLRDRRAVPLRWSNTGIISIKAYSLYCHPASNLTLFKKTVKMTSSIWSHI